PMFKMPHFALHPSPTKLSTRFQATNIIGTPGLTRQGRPAFGPVGEAVPMRPAGRAGRRPRAQPRRPKSFAFGWCRLPGCEGGGPRPTPRPAFARSHHRHFNSMVTFSILPVNGNGSL